MTRLNEGTSIRREIHVHGIEAPVNVEITSEGLSFSVKGTKKRVSIGWVQVIKGTNTPVTVPSFLMGRPYEFLQSQAVKRLNKSVDKQGKT